jgi:hypothetical protein
VVTRGGLTTSAGPAAPAYLPPVTIAQDECPPCDYTRASVVKATIGGAVGGALLMYVVGLLTREFKKKRR